MTDRRLPPPWTVVPLARGLQSDRRQWTVARLLLCPRERPRRKHRRRADQYRWPKRTLQAAAIILGAVAIGAWWLLYRPSQDSPWEAEQAARAADGAKVLVTVKYSDGACKADHPMQVYISNLSSRTVNAVTWELEAYVPGHSTNVVPFLNRTNSSDAILKPGFSQTVCYALPKFEGTELPPALLDFKVVSPMVTFSNP